jgi:hypothetical protein
MPWLTGDLTVETGSKMLATFIALFGALCAIPALSRFVRVKRAVYALSRTTLDTRGLPTNLLPRTGLNASLLNSLEDPYFNTVLVYGVRGSGKTTAIQRAPNKRLGVTEWTMAAEDGPSATAELKENWRALFVRWSKPEDRAFDKKVCSSVAANNPLVVVVSVEASASPSALKSLLHFCKTMSYNTQLVSSIPCWVPERTSAATKQSDKQTRI